MRDLTPQEKRTIRIGSVLLGVYLVLFCGARTWKALERKREDYLKLVKDAQTIKQEFYVYEKRSLLIEQLQKRFNLDPSRLSKTTLTADVSVAIQKAAQMGSIQLGPVRETSSRATAKEIATMQLEAAGQVPAITAFLYRLETLGYPILIDSVLMTPQQSRPGTIKATISIVILDFDQWKAEAMRHA
jgi:hypothetical protein